MLAQLSNSRRGSGLLAFVIYLAAALVFLYPIPLKAGSAIDNHGDPLLNIWILAWDWRALTTHPLGLFDANIFFPNLNTLAYSENLVVTSLLSGPVYALSGNPVLAYNLVLIASFPLTALAAYALVRHLTGAWIAALIGGFIFAFAHYRLGQLSHLQLLTGWWVPLALLWLHRFAEKPSVGRAALVGLVIGLQFWTSIYFALYLVIAAAVFAAWALAIGLLRLNRPTLIGTCVAAATAAIIVAPGVPAYYRVQDVVGHRQLAEQEGAAVADYLRPQPNSLLGRALGASATASAGGKWEHTLFPGLVALALAAVGLSRPAGRAGASATQAQGINAVAYNWPGFYLLLAVTGLVLSFGPTLKLTAEGLPLVRGMPYAWLYSAIPPLAALRVPARLALLLMLALAVLAGRGAALLVERLRARDSRGQKPALPPRWAAAGIGLLLVIEYLSLPVPNVPLATGAAVPPVYRWLGSQQFDGGVFELPTARTSNITNDQLSIRRIALQQYFSVYHWHPIVIGYSGTNAPTFKDVIDYAPAAASPAGLDFLRRLGVSRLVVHRDQLTWDEWATFAESAARQPGLALVAEVGAASVYAITPAEATVEAQWQTVDLALDPALTLVAVELPANDRFTAGEAFVVRLTWQGDPRLAKDWALSLQLTDSAGEKVSQADYFFPTAEEWPPGEDLLQRSILTLPRDLLPGPYTLRAIRYRQSDLAPLGQPVTLARLRVNQPPEFLIQHLLSATLGDAIQLVGYDAPGQARAGESLPLALYWRRLASIQDDYTVFVHLRRADGSFLAQKDNPPRGGRYPTSAWREGETIIDRYLLDIPPDTAAGTYALVIGMYLPPGNERLPAFDASGQLLPDESVELGIVEVVP